LFFLGRRLGCCFLCRVGLALLYEFLFLLLNLFDGLLEVLDFALPLLLFLLGQFGRLFLRLFGGFFLFFGALLLALHFLLGIFRLFDLVFLVFLFRLGNRLGGLFFGGFGLRVQLFGVF